MLCPDRTGRNLNLAQVHGVGGGDTRDLLALCPLVLTINILSSLRCFVLIYLLVFNFIHVFI